MNRLTPMLIPTITADRRREAEAAMRVRAARCNWLAPWLPSDPALTSLFRRALFAVADRRDPAS